MNAYKSANTPSKTPTAISWRTPLPMPAAPAFPQSFDTRDPDTAEAVELTPEKSQSLPFPLI